MALTDNIIHYWTMDSDATDSVGSADGTVGGATNTTGKINNGYDFDGTNDNINLDGTMQGTYSAYSVSFWFQIDDFSGLRRVYIFREAVGDNDLLQFYTNGSGTMTTGFRIAGTLKNSSHSSLSTSTWYHYVFTFDGTTHKTYINAGTPTSDATVTGNFVLDSSHEAELCAYNGSTYVDGKVDEVGIWDRELSAAEVSELYNSGSGLQYPFGAAEVTNTDALWFGTNF